MSNVILMIETVYDSSHILSTDVKTASLLFERIQEYHKLSTELLKFKNNLGKILTIVLGSITNINVKVHVADPESVEDLGIVHWFLEDENKAEELPITAPQQDKTKALLELFYYHYSKLLNCLSSLDYRRSDGNLHEKSSDLNNGLNQLLQGYIFICAVRQHFKNKKLSGELLLQKDIVISMINSLEESTFKILKAIGIDRVKINFKEGQPYENALLTVRFGLHVLLNTFENFTVCVSGVEINERTVTYVEFLDGEAKAYVVDIEKILHEAKAVDEFFADASPLDDSEKSVPSPVQDVVVKLDKQDTAPSSVSQEPMTGVTPKSDQDNCVLKIGFKIPGPLNEEFLSRRAEFKDLEVLKNLRDLKENGRISVTALGTNNVNMGGKEIYFRNISYVRLYISGNEIISFYYRDVFRPSKKDLKVLIQAVETYLI